MQVASVWRGTFQSFGERGCSSWRPYSELQRSHRSCSRSLNSAALAAGVLVAGHLLYEAIQDLDHLLEVGPPLWVGVPAPRDHLLQRLHRQVHARESGGPAPSTDIGVSTAHSLGCYHAFATHLERAIANGMPKL